MVKYVDLSKNYTDVFKVGVARSVSAQIIDFIIWQGWDINCPDIHGKVCYLSIYLSYLIIYLSIYPNQFQYFILLVFVLLTLGSLFVNS